MKYLGVMISSDGRMEKEVEARIGGATRVIGGLNDVVLRRKELSRSTKLKVVNATVMPTLLYGCETWTLSKQQQLFETIGEQIGNIVGPSNTINNWRWSSFAVTRVLMHFRPETTIGVFEQCLSQFRMFDMILPSPDTSYCVFVSVVVMLFKLKQNTSRGGTGIKPKLMPALASLYFWFDKL